MRKIGLYSESIPYTEKVLELRRSSGNIKGEYFSLQALGYTYYKLKKYNQSELYYRKALNLARALSPEHRAIASVDLADVKLKLGETDSALFLVRNAIDSVNSFTKNSVLATGAKVYLKAGITDSAYIFARKLIRSSNHNNRHVGYYVLLSPEMRKFSSQDSLMQYISEYRDMTHKSIEDVGSDMVINKYNYYDYKKHDRDKADALAKVAKLKSVIIILIICLVISINFNLFSFFAYLVKRRGLKVSTSQSRAIENHKSDKEKEELRKKLLSDITSKSDSDSKDEVLISDLKDSYIFSKLLLSAKNF